MRADSPDSPQPLRSGYTTGACATACSLAAARRLLGAVVGESVQIQLPKGQTVEFSLRFCRDYAGHCVEAGTIKDAGDDPDVTHGALVFARVALVDTPEVRFFAGPGVGTVTRSGLSLAVGEPAINPVPRQMIRQHLQQLAAECGYQGGFAVTLGIENGEQLALKTMNPRLGIVGGLSILGTTGIVRPFSCSAYIASIHQGMQVALSNGYHHLAACTGNASEQAMRQHYMLDGIALIEMGDFAGAVLKQLKRCPVPKLSICGGFAKIAKLAAGHLDLHSRHSQLDLSVLQAEAQALGADAKLVQAIAHANTALEVLQLAQAQSLALADAVCRRALGFARPYAVHTELEVFAVDRQGQIVGHAQ